MRIFLTLCLFFTVLSSNAFAKEWYEGGNLHGATVQQWNAADEHNKIATSGDWVHVTTDNTYIRQVMAIDPKILHQLDVVLSQCVTKSAKGLAGNMQASTLAVLCLSSFKEQSPEFSWLLSKAK